MKFHTASIETALKEVSSSAKGLTSKEAKERLAKWGPNVLTEKKKRRALDIFLDQFRSFIIWILIGAAVIALFFGEFLDSIVILIIVVLNSIMGFLQEYRAEKSIEALKKMASLHAEALRDGKRIKIPAEELVPGDIIFLAAGAKVPADCRIIEAANLEAQESQLTGESLPVRKQTEKIADKIVSDQENMAFSGTIVTKGRGTGLVIGTGMDTEIGKIAVMIDEAPVQQIPLQQKLASLGRFLGISVIILCIIIFIAGVLAKQDVIHMLLASVSLAVAAIPEGLPAVVTIALALGVQRMAKRNALIRRLPSVETLGCTTVICTDKTGTLTKDEMTVVAGYSSSGKFEVSGQGYEPKGRISRTIDDELKLLFRIGTLCNDSQFQKGEPVGDPTELALMVSAMKAGIDKAAVEKASPRIDEIPFESERKLMSTVHKDGKQRVMYTKGAADVLLKLCTQIWEKGTAKTLTDKKRKEVLSINEEYAKKALRVLACAYKPLDAKAKPAEKGLVFVGLQAMIDPPREDVKEAIKECREAGIRVVMITGDHKLTAVAIAEKLGISGKAITGEELDRIKDLGKAVEGISVYARVSPEHKMKIVTAWQKKGHIVAMTGDGINDAPALKKADIGIAMGQTGTDVAKEASAMILTDDRFTSIVRAVEEGRGIYDNIQKFILYLLSSNLGEILTLFVGILLRLPMPLLAIHILWVNLVTDGLPALALSVDPRDKCIMQRPPRKKDEEILNSRTITDMIVVGIIMMAGTLGLFMFYDPIGNYTKAVTVAFCTLVMFQLFNVLNCRSGDRSIFQTGLFGNIYLIGAIVSSILLQLMVVYLLPGVFKVEPLALMDWVPIVAVSSTVFLAMEVVKMLQRVRARSRDARRT